MISDIAFALTDTSTICNADLISDAVYPFEFAKVIMLSFSDSKSSVLLILLGVKSGKDSSASFASSS